MRLRHQLHTASLISCVGFTNFLLFPVDPQPIDGRDGAEHREEAEADTETKGDFLALV
jgi:hypothetical protein